MVPGNNMYIDVLDISDIMWNSSDEEDEDAENHKKFAKAVYSNAGFFDPVSNGFPAKKLSVLRRMPHVEKLQYLFSRRGWRCHHNTRSSVAGDRLSYFTLPVPTLAKYRKLQFYRVVVPGNWDRSIPMAKE